MKKLVQNLLLASFLLISSIFLVVPSVGLAACNDKSVTASGTNEWQVSLSPCADFTDTGISFKSGDTLRIAAYDDPTNMKFLVVQFNDSLTDSSGTKVSTKDQTLKVRLNNTNSTIGFGGLTIVVTKIPKGTATTNTNTSTNTNTVPQTPDEPIPAFKNPTGVSYVVGLLTRVIQILLSTIGAVAVIVIVIAGFRLVVMGDSESERSSAKKSITWAILGLIFALMSFSIVTIIQRVLQT